MSTLKYRRFAIPDIGCIFYPPVIYQLLIILLQILALHCKYITYRIPGINKEYSAIAKTEKKSLQQLNREDNENATAKTEKILISITHKHTYT